MKPVKVTGKLPNMAKNDISHIVNKFRTLNPQLEIEKVSNMLDVVLETFGMQRKYKFYEDENNIKVEVIEWYYKTVNYLN